MSSKKQKWSTKDLVNKWQRKLPKDVQRSLPWDVLDVLASGLSDDTKLPREVFKECIRTRDISGLFQITKSLDVTLYTSADLLLQDRLAVELFKKYNFPNSPFNKREKAKLRFYAAENDCREANHRILRGIGLSTEVNGVIHEAIKMIDSILGAFSVDEMSANARFGPGSTLCVKGDKTSAYFKYACQNPSVSTEAFPYAEALFEYDPQWKALMVGIHPFDVVGPFSPMEGGVELQVCDHNKVTFVPKNAETERSIGIENYFGVFFQLGVGAMIRRRLKRVGIDLNSQLRNQALARKGSIDGKTATVDKVTASDCLATEAVRLLVMPSWFDHLDRLRSKTYVMEDRKPVPYFKFSSMGNGFTFELETLIFYACAMASCRQLGVDSSDVSVFGDDVIIPVEALALYEQTCNYLGFRFNEEKSFSKGQFRESCGEDFLGGTRVRPVFCEELRSVRDVANLANRLFELNRSVGTGSRINGMLSRTISLLHQRIPRDVREHIVGPPSEDMDGYIHTTDFSALTASGLVRWNRFLFAWEHPTIRFSATKFSRRDDAAALFIVKGLESNKPLYPCRIEKDYINGLMAIDPFSPCVTDFISEQIPREITGRKIGKYVLGKSLVWSLGDR